MAAVLAAGPGAVLSHSSAAALWEIRASGRLEVTSSCRHALPRISTHQASLEPDEVTVLRAIPVTTLPRTLLDLAATLSPARVERAINEAEYRRLTDPLSLAQLVERHRGRRGIATIRRIVDSVQPGGWVMRSELEADFVRFISDAGLPMPELNVHLRLGAHLIECDCVWRDRRVVVELDGRAAHTTSAAFERDRARDRALQAQGWRVVRVTWRQIHSESARLAADLGRILAKDLP